MDAVTLSPPSTSFSCNQSNPLTASLCSVTFFSFGVRRARRVGNASLCLCYGNPSDPRSPDSGNSDFGFPFNPFSVLVPFLRNIRDLAASQTQKWASRVESSGDADGVGDKFGGDYLQSSGLGIALLSVTANARHRISPFVATLAANPTFVSGLLAWFIAQSIKVFLNFFVERKWDLRILFASGGMPSSHSALCTALTTSVAFCHGVADSLFPVCLGFSLIVMYDAIGVRRHAGMQAKVLNMIVEDLFQGHPISQRKLKELLGHTPSQVLAGALLGILVACFCCQGCLVAA